MSRADADTDADADADADAGTDAAGRPDPAASHPDPAVSRPAPAPAMSRAAVSRTVLVERPGVHRLIERPVPAPGPGEVRVRVAAAGICMSDRELHEGHRAPGYVRYPIVPGHEWSGTVDAVGAGVDPALLGRPCVAEGFRACGHCERCRYGETSLCTAGYAETGFTEPGGGYVRMYEAAELIRRGAPLYLKFGLSRAAGIYPYGAHLRELALATARERVRRGRLVLDLLARHGADGGMSPLGSRHPGELRRFDADTSPVEALRSS
ncbi:alcohol dehydrogenase catalytic domain-containing protein [Streptomyces flavochromogenes]|uniref:alcohol dehydrogenase catalytic domain-containing protein n=1 Tax=Streptomyces flavochromogenes TaxID=68199 RepID=UPI0004C1E44A|nr:alcohol dehydrogenase catalytic domain-containing protein [Streptomyces flavochromogenes]